MGEAGAVVGVRHPHVKGGQPSLVDAGGGRVQHAASQAKYQAHRHLGPNPLVDEGAHVLELLPAEY
jgi:hypothetical protein